MPTIMLHRTRHFGGGNIMFIVIALFFLKNIHVICQHLRKRSISASTPSFDTNESLGSTE